MSRDCAVAWPGGDEALGECRGYSPDNRCMLFDRNRSRCGRGPATKPSTSSTSAAAAAATATATSTAARPEETDDVTLPTESGGGGSPTAAPGDALRPNAAARMCNGKADPDVCGQLPPEECEAPGVQAFCPVHCNGCPAGVGAAGAGARGAGDPVSTAPRRETPDASRAEAETEASKDVFTPSVIGGVAGCAALFATLALVRWWRPRNTQAQPGAHDEEELHGTQLPAPAKQGSAGNNRVAETALDDDYTNLDDDYTEIGTSAPADDTYDLGHAPGTDTYDLGHGQAASAAGKTPHERVVNSEGEADSEEEI